MGKKLKGKTVKGQDVKSDKNIMRPGIYGITNFPHLYIETKLSLFGTKQ
jgi:hypothetical protein